MLTQHRVHDRSAAGIRDENHIDVGCTLEHFDRDLVTGRGSIARQGQVAGLGACRRDQIGKRTVR